MRQSISDLCVIHIRDQSQLRKIVVRMREHTRESLQ